MEEYLLVRHRPCGFYCGFCGLLHHGGPSHRLRPLLLFSVLVLVLVHERSGRANLDLDDG